MGKGKVLAIDTPTLLALVGVAPTTLNYWITKGFCTPSLDTGSGPRATRYWTVKDVLVIRAIKALRSAGCSLQNIARVDSLLKEDFGQGFENAVLIYDGRDVMIERDNTISSLLQNRGQGVFVEALTFVALPLAPWATDVEARGQLIDVDAIRKRRAARRDRPSAA